MTTPQTLKEALPCTCIDEDDHAWTCPARHRPAIQVWHEAQVAEKDARIAELEDRAENLLIAIGMGWDLGGCADRLNGLLPDRAALPQEGEACWPRARRRSDGIV